MRSFDPVVCGGLTEAPEGTISPANSYSTAATLKSLSMSRLAFFIVGRGTIKFRGLKSA